MFSEDAEQRGISATLLNHAGRVDSGRISERVVNAVVLINGSV